MGDRDKKKDELISELQKLRKKIARLERDRTGVRKHTGKPAESPPVERIFRTLPVMVMAFDSRGTVIHWNEECERVTGYTAEEIEGNPNSISLLHPASDQQAQFVRDWSKTGMEFFGKDFDLVSKDGRLKMISWSCVSRRYPVPGWDFWWVGADITNCRGTLQAFKDAETQYRDLYENAPVGYHMAGPNRKIIDINQTELDLIGYTREEIVNKKSIRDLISEEFFDRYESLWAQFQKKEIDEAKGIEFCMVHKEGRRIPVRLDATVIRDVDRNLLRTRCVVVDISEPKRLEVELRQAKEQAENATGLKDKFVSLVSHDLRSPFVAILETLKFLEGSSDRPSNSEQRDLIRHSLNTCESALTMIDQLLNISRLQTGKIKPRFRFSDGRDLCESQIEKLKYLADKKGIQLFNEIPKGCRLYVDPELFGGVVQNLLSNAVKFCGKGDVVTVFVPNREKGSLAVKDSGPGINKKLLPNLFKFEEKTATFGTGGERGSGLGLPFSKEIVDLHSGTLTVETEEKKGSTFTIRLPNVLPKILIVDDTLEDRIFLKKMLQDLEVEIREAENGENGFRSLIELSPHLIITDCRMPILDGIGFIKKIRSNKETEGIPVILMTSANNPGFRETALKAGADDFFIKPLSREDLLARVESFLQAGG